MRQRHARRRLPGVLAADAPLGHDDRTRARCISGNRLGTSEQRNGIFRALVYNKGSLVLHMACGG